MKRYLVFVALLGLGFGACKKEQASEPEKPTVETIKIAGHDYPKDSIMNVFEKYSGFTKERFIFNQEKEQFYIADYKLFVEPSDYIILKK
ncbi:hypothetical protein [Sphingobacterium paramultivorum]|uniref:hypothetical protein n=1 Tax=Sphingobacterium paramultivorum TaxID=2886510 RepID=UPI00129C6B4D|nr:hypothetical protein [Sphingobacterium paramultivorum]